MKPPVAPCGRVSRARLICYLRRRSASPRAYYQSCPSVSSVPSPAPGGDVGHCRVVCRGDDSRPAQQPLPAWLHEEPCRAHVTPDAEIR